METNNQEKEQSKTLRNITYHLRHMAQIYPYKRAVICKSGRDKNGKVKYCHLTFRQLDQESDDYAYGLQDIGISQGMRAVVLMDYSIEYYVVIFALLKIGAIPIFLDSNMDKNNIVKCLSSVKPEAFIGNFSAHMLRIKNLKAFQTIKICVSKGFKLLTNCICLNNLRYISPEPYKIVTNEFKETVLIQFSSGCTGDAKAVLYHQGMIDTQLNMFINHYGITKDEIDMSLSSLYSILAVSMGMTTIVTGKEHIQDKEPASIIETFWDHGITNIFSSPFFIESVGRFGKEKNIYLPSLKRVVSSGAMPEANDLEKFQLMLYHNVDIFNLYGSTEAPSICSIGSNEILSSTREKTDQGFGICVGRPFNKVKIRIIKITDKPIESWSEDLLVQDGEIGELVVKADNISRKYCDNPDLDSLTKIQDGNDIYHRMGDVGWIDSLNRFWFCGRKNDRVIFSEDETLFTIPCESVFNQNPRINKCALIGLGEKPYQQPIICIQLEKSDSGKFLNALRRELIDLAKNYPHTEKIRDFIFIKKLPVDPFYNTKLLRDKLKIIAEKKIKPEKNYSYNSILKTIKESKKYNNFKLAIKSYTEKIKQFLQNKNIIKSKFEDNL